MKNLDQGRRLAKNFGLHNVIGPFGSGQTSNLDEARASVYIDSVKYKGLPRQPRVDLLSMIDGISLPPP